MAAKTKERKDAIELLKQDHEKVRGLLRQLEKAATDDAADAEPLLRSIESALHVHTTIEEEIFYPAFRDAASKREDAKLFYDAMEEHCVVDLLLPEIDKGEFGSHDFAAKAKVLRDLVEHHAEEEEKEMFPRARKLIGEDELVMLGRQLAERKHELQGEDDDEE